MKKNKNELYCSPEVEVIGAQVQTIICQSNSAASIEDMPETDMNITF